MAARTVGQNAHLAALIVAAISPRGKPLKRSEIDTLKNKGINKTKKKYWN